MTVALVAALVHALRLVAEWRRGTVSIETPRLRRRGVPTPDLDRHSSTIWDAASVVEVAGLMLGFLGVGRLEGGQAVGLIGLGILLVGSAIRWAAIRALGRLFTGVVTIQDGHELVRRGLYRYVRHPAYTGTLLAHLGLGLAFASWVSIALSTIPFLAAAAYRIRVEEEALRQEFGAAYSGYAERTWRLIPWVY